MTEPDDRDDYDPDAEPTMTAPQGERPDGRIPVDEGELDPRTASDPDPELEES
jgi:hypothetical protein